jgi:hypothetical protein
MIPTRHSFGLGLLALSAAMLTGCWQGPAEVQVESRAGRMPLVYEVLPDGMLRVEQIAPGRAVGDRELFVTQLDARATRRLSNVVWDSGFLFDNRSEVDSRGEGGPLIIGAKVGAFGHRMDIRSGQVPSALKIVAELNTHLPPELQIPYRPAGEEWLHDDDDWRIEVDHDMEQFQ